jgi:diguanylate cyclase (GGDEF)-like protein
MGLNQEKTVKKTTWLVYLSLGVAAIGTYYMLPRAGVAQGVLLTAVNATASAAAFRAAARTTGRQRTVWGFLGISMALASLANGTYYAIPLITGHAVPFPHLVDVAWLLTYPCYGVALYVLAKQRRRDERRGNALDSTLVIVAGAALMWIFIIDPIVNTSGLTLPAHIVSVFYPIGDLIVFAMLVRIVVGGSRTGGATQLLLASFVALLAADVVYAVELGKGLYAYGGPTDGLWMASYLLIGAAALHPHARTLPRPAAASGQRVTKARLAFLSGSALVGPILLMVNMRVEHDFFLACVSGVSFLLVMARVTGLNRALASMSTELETRAITDSLTGLVNREHLQSHIDQSITHTDSDVGLLLIDLDDFKAVNDVAGHSAGDAVLIAVAARLSSVVRSTDVVARLGGDEFAILLDDVAAAESLAERLIGDLAQPFSFGGREFTVGASVGIASSGDALSVERLIQNADIAMYVAKRGGKGRVVVFDDSMYVEIVDRSDFAKELHGALGRGEMRVAYQPIVHLDTGVTVGLEALARWNHHRLGEIAPARFIPIAEESGDIVELGRWILATALDDLASLDRTSQPELGLSVNIAVRQLLEPGFCADVSALLTKTGVDPRRLTVEVTESAMIEENSDAVKCLHGLRTLGIRSCIDDFGTGYSSLAYLKRLPVEGLKIDQAFVAAVDQGIEDAAVARAILRIGDTLGMWCVAEGVETNDQVEALRAAGCQFAQGFYFARPMPIDDLVDYIELDETRRIASHRRVVIVDEIPVLTRSKPDLVPLISPLYTLDARDR